MAKANKRKGSGFELEIIKKLNEIGFDGCVSSRSANRRLDNNKVDICDEKNELPILIQAKYTSQTPNFHTIKKECTIKDKPFSIIWKKADKGCNSPGTVALVDIDFFYKLLEMYYKYNINKK